MERINSTERIDSVLMWCMCCQSGLYIKLRSEGRNAGGNKRYLAKNRRRWGKIARFLFSREMMDGGMRSKYSQPRWALLLASKAIIALSTLDYSLNTGIKNGIA